MVGTSSRFIESIFTFTEQSLSNTCLQHAEFLFSTPRTKQNSSRFLYFKLPASLRPTNLSKANSMNVVTDSYSIN